MPILKTEPSKNPSPSGTGNWLGYVVILIVAICLLAGLIYSYLWQGKPATDDIGCLVNDPPPEVIAIMIDRTDPISPRQAALIGNKLRAIKDGTQRVLNAEGVEEKSEPLREWTEFRAYTVGPVSREVLPIDFRACLPGNPKDVDITTESRRRAERVWAEFNEKFERYLTDIAPSSSESQSPLIESIQSIGATTFSHPQFNSEPKTRKRLIIISDMLQNSDLFSHYRVWLNCRTDIIGAAEQCVEKSSKKGETCTMFGGRRSESCERAVDTNLDYNYWKKRVGKRLKSEMRGVDVEVIYVGREGLDQQGSAHAEFWHAYFLDNKARSFRVDPIW